MNQQCSYRASQHCSQIHSLWLGGYIGLTMSQGCCTGPPGYICWQDGMNLATGLQRSLHPNHTVTKFIVPKWGMQLTPVQECRTGLPAYLAWWAGTTTLCHKSTLSPQSGTMNWAYEEGRGQKHDSVEKQHSQLVFVTIFLDYLLYQIFLWS